MCFSHAEPYSYRGNTSYTYETSYVSTLNKFPSLVGYLSVNETESAILVCQIQGEPLLFRMKDYEIVELLLGADLSILLKIKGVEGDAGISWHQLS